MPGNADSVTKENLIDAAVTSSLNDNLTERKLHVDDKASKSVEKSVNTKLSASKNKQTSGKIVETPKDLPNERMTLSENTKNKVTVTNPKKSKSVLIKQDNLKRNEDKKTKTNHKEANVETVVDKKSKKVRNDKIDKQKSADKKTAKSEDSKSNNKQKVAVKKSEPKTAKIKTEPSKTLKKNKSASLMSKNKKAVATVKANKAKVDEKLKIEQSADKKLSKKSKTVSKTQSLKPLKPEVDAKKQSSKTELVAKKQAVTPSDSYADLFEKAKESLKEIERTINVVYKKYFESQNNFKHTNAELISATHEYLQALFMLDIAERGINEQQLQFIYSLLKKADLFEGVNGFKQVFEKARRIVKKVPLSFYCFVAVDKSAQQNLSSEFINSVYEIYTLLYKLQSKINIKKKKELLAELINFAKQRGVLIND